MTDFGSVAPERATRPTPNLIADSTTDTALTRRVTIALDAMGGDHGPAVVVPAALDYLARDPEIDLILVGRVDVIRGLLPGGQAPERLSIRHATQEVAMTELPSKVLRNKKDSSMRVAIDLVKAGVAHACVSAGNTGALMATARFVLKTLPHIDRPAIITALPSIGGRTWVLDLGANVDCTAAHLLQFAVMGAELVSAVDDVASPRVGLLNIGQEEIKGNEQVKGAHELLSCSALNYAGYVEGDDIYLGDFDVIVVNVPGSPALAGHALFREAVRVLRPGGRCVVVTKPARASSPGAGPARAGHAAMAPAELVETMRGAGFRAARLLAEREGLAFAEGVKSAV